MPTENSVEAYGQGVRSELKLLGHDLAESTVAKYMLRPLKPPSQTWRTFVDTHVQDLVAIDFFTVPTATFRVLFGFVVPRHDRRRVVHFNVATSPTARWTAQQMVGPIPFDYARVPGRDNWSAGCPELQSHTQR